MTKTPYTSIEKVEAYLIQEIETGFEANVERWILAVSRMMDDMANRQLVTDTYESDEEWEERLFDVDQYGYVSIDDCTDIDKVFEERGDNNLVTISDYKTYPGKPPYRKIRYPFARGLQTVCVRAKWGYMDEITPDLEWAATVLVAGICIANQAVSGTNPRPIIKEKIGNYEVACSAEKQDGAASLNDLEEAKTIIASYRRILI